MTNCIIIEDQLPAQRILKKFIADIGTLKLVATFSDALGAMEFLQSTSVDLLFLDIHLPKLSGIDFLKTVSNPPRVILTTAFPDYALEGYELDVVDYLLKPFSFQRFVKAVSKVARRNTQPQPTPVREIFLKSGYEHIRIDIQDILYIKSDADYTEIHLKDKKHLSSEPLKYWEDKLDSQQFIRIHKSYIVNLSWIEKIGGNLAHLSQGTTLPIGRAYKTAFTDKFMK